MRVKIDKGLRTVDAVSAKVQGSLRFAYVGKAKIGGVLRTVWELIRGFIFTSSGSSLLSKDGSVLKCKNK